MSSSSELFHIFGSFTDINNTTMVTILEDVTAMMNEVPTKALISCYLGLELLNSFCDKTYNQRYMYKCRSNV